MSALRISYPRLRRKAEQLLEGQTEPPIDLDIIVARLGAEVRRSVVEADISGILYRQGTRKVIVVNASHSPVRQRFTIAHELAHLVLHRGDGVHVDQGFRINLRDPRSASAELVEEIEANALAANLLMPADWLRRDLRDETVDLEDDHEIGALAERYGVSVQAMLVRLTSLFHS